MKTIILTLAYDGSNYAGWQIQKNVVSVQECLEKAIERASGCKYSVLAAGRTDSGVHAYGQVVSFETDDSFLIPESKIAFAINSKLPRDIQIRSVNVFNGKFHARFDAKFREYKYFLTTKYDIFDRNYSTFIKFKIDKRKLFDAAEIFVRNTNFTTFSKFNPDNKNPVCDVVLSQWDQIDDFKSVYTVKSNHFLYGMVRSVVGAMVDISRDKRSVAEVEDSLYQQNRKLNSPLVKPNGLFLNKVYYDEGFRL